MLDILFKGLVIVGAGIFVMAFIFIVILAVSSFIDMKPDENSNFMKLYFNRKDDNND